MQRVHVLEFEDLSWFPRWLRGYMTDVLVVFGQKLGLPGAVARLVREARGEASFDTIVDLGSGSGGSMPDVQRALREQGEELALVLSDLHPSPEVVARYSQHDSIRYESAPVDATALSRAPAGLKTMVNCFHHMRPRQARAILASAQDTGEPFLMVELAEPKIPFAAWLLGLPLGLPLVFLMGLLLSFAVRPMTPRRALFTFLLPLVPLFYAWDGQASMPRIYTRADLEELLAELKERPSAANYRWRIGVGESDAGKDLGFYLLGVPTQP